MNFSKALPHAFAALLLGGTTVAGSASTPAAAGEQSGQQTVTVWKVDMSGRPPYRRERVEVPVLDAAALETPATGDVPTVEQWAVETSGKPPHKRRRIELPIVDAAALEMNDMAEPERPRFRGRPPFRRH